MKGICYDLFYNQFFFLLKCFVHIKLSYCWFNRQELLEKPKDRYHNGSGKKEAAEYHINN